jgi:hypothetical protein
MKEIDFSKPLEIFIMNDQPFTCPYCGSRCEEFSNFHHTAMKLFINKCMNEGCGFICGEIEDQDFLNCI